MKLVITIDNTENAAFGEGQEERDQEICRVLRGVVRSIEGSTFSLTEDFEEVLRDINGNAVGKIEVTQ